MRVAGNMLNKQLRTASKEIVFQLGTDRKIPHASTQFVLGMKNADL
jgi:hypothetical protein